MSKFCPTLGRKVVYLTCQECDDRVCERPTFKVLPKQEDETESKVESNDEEGFHDNLKDIPCPCDDCCHKVHSRIDWLFGRKAKIVICRMYKNAVIDVKKIVEKGCEFHNKDMSQEDICMNCEHYLGGGDWGLSCAADYYTLTNATSPVCAKFSRKRGSNENG